MRSERARRVSDRLLRVLLTLLTLGVLAVPVSVAVHQVREKHKPRPGRPLVAERVVVPAPQPRELAGLPRIPAYTNGIPVLSYHGIGVEGERYTVTPAEFAAQMAAVRRAGFNAITERDFATYVTGGAVDLPPRPIVITFDDGVKSIWVYGDEILRRERLRAISYLITARVGDRQPYYLTWQEVRTMRATGRWEFGAHTRDGHRRIPATATREAPFLTNRMWLATQGRRETVAEWTARVRRDLDGSLADFRRAGLPRPLSFADPFSSTGSANVDAELLPRLLDLELARFPVLVNNRVPGALARRGDARSYVRRIEVFRGTSGPGLVREIARAISRPPERRRR